MAEELVKGALYLVPTPIGNLGDMTFRAVDVLRRADLILAEDTRHTQKLLNHFAIENTTLSFHKFNTQERLPEVLSKLKNGATLAEVSDAGMPVISDPGEALVKACVDADIPVIPLPGPNAALTALIASGLPATSFLFAGFLAKKAAARTAQLERYTNREETLIFYESPHRLAETLADCLKVFGGERAACVVRELTKQHEEFRRGTLSELVSYYDANPEVKGEICLLVAGVDHALTETEQLQAEIADRPLKEQVEWWMARDQLSAKAAIKKVAQLTQTKKQDVYAAYHEL